ncbi:branched-chain amino acid transaminase [Pontibacter ramchanderi]|uniref:Branched-chain-amino-acid aminotransferase n=1 Tax=Pontibacter ramchanderi TaxID=1179743 RepID=A0A2N3U827_9BACT|nr:branched-chain amino acid transaminase [Pontibacter ramchanderi]PKV62903.1 branched-chain amino acid aminotransferase [Pontibacter ramchanderi]
MYFNDNTLVFLDGHFVKPEQASCSVYAQSLHYGYAAFEGLRSYSTTAGIRIFKAKEHYERLHYSCQAVGLPLAYTVEELTALTYELLELNRLSDAYIRPLVYAGEPNMGIKAPATSNLFIAAWEWGKYLGDQCLRLMISPYERPNPKAVPIEAKISGHYANSIVASSDAKMKGYDEALLLDMHGFVAEGPGSNFFFEKNGELYTAPAGSILQGITRATVIELAREAGVRVHEQFFRPEELLEAEGAFLTGTAAEVVGVSSIGEHVFRKPYADTIGAQLAQQYTALVTGKAAPHLLST